MLISYNKRTGTYWLYDKERDQSFFCDSTGNKVSPNNQCLKWTRLDEVPSDVLQGALEDAFIAAQDYVMATVQYPSIDS